MTFGGSAVNLVNSCRTEHIDVAFLSETHLKPHERFFIPNWHFYWTDCFPRKKGGTAVAVRKGIPHCHVDLPQHVSVEATGVCLLTGNSEVLLADITVLLRFT
jgi:hypothetical protein